MSDSVRPHRRQPTRLPCPWDSPGKNTGVSCHFHLQGVKVKSLSSVRPSATPWTAAFKAPLSMGFSRQEYWSGVPLPSPRLKGDQRSTGLAPCFHSEGTEAHGVTVTICSRTGSWPCSWVSRGHREPTLSLPRILPRQPGPSLWGTRRRPGV